MDECRKALEKVERLACEALANPSDNDSKTLVAICTTVEAALAARTEAKVSGEVVTREAIDKAYWGTVTTFPQGEIGIARGLDAVYALQLPAPQPVLTGEAFEAGWDAAYENMDNAGPILSRAKEKYLDSRPHVPATTDPRDVVLPWAELMDLIAYFNTFGDDKAEAMLRGLKPVQSVVPECWELLAKVHTVATINGGAIPGETMREMKSALESYPDYRPSVVVVPSVDRWTIDHDCLRLDSEGVWVKYEDIAHLLTRQPSIQPDLSKVVKALEFYAKRDNWFASEHGPSQVMIHLSSIARDALYDLRNGGVQ